MRRLKRKLRSIWDADSRKSLNQAIRDLRFRRLAGMIMGPRPGCLSYYPGFSAAANDLKTFVATNLGLFTVMLRDGSIIHFEPADPGLFHFWLASHGVADVKATERLMQSPSIHKKNESKDKHEGSRGG